MKIEHSLGNFECSIIIIIIGLHEKSNYFYLKKHHQFSTPNVINKVNSVYT